METITCCICGDETPDYASHNPDPVTDGPEDRCCSHCNYTVVLPARMREMKLQD